MVDFDDFDGGEQIIDLRDRPERYLLSPPNVGPAEQQALSAAFDSGWIAPVGPQLDEFEARFAEAVGVPAALAVASGTAAIHLGLRLVGVGPGDEVAVSSLTFAASANPIRYQGAYPVFIDSERDTWNMDPNLLEDWLHERARRDRLPAAVVVVDIFGQCAQLGRIRQLCDQFGVPIVEDAAEALGASHLGRSAGTYGRLGAFSFNGNKTITTSGGGMLVGQPDDIERARFLSTQAKDPVPWYEHREVGYNYRMSNLLAGVGIAQLARLDELVGAQRDVNALYRSAFDGHDAIEMMPNAEEGEPSNWLSVITVGDGVDTEVLRQRLDGQGIEARAVWKPLHMQGAFHGSEVVGGEVSEDLFRTGLCLPSGTQLTERDIDYISRSVMSGVDELRVTRPVAAVEGFAAAGG